MKPIVLIQNPDGTIKITFEEIQRIVNNAYVDGYSDGKASADTGRRRWLDDIVVTCKSPEVYL